MIAGSLADLAGLNVPGAEYAIALSIVAIALPVAFAHSVGNGGPLRAGPDTGSDAGGFCGQVMGKL